MRRTLALKKDTLAELATGELRGVVAGSAASCITCLDCLIAKTSALLSGDEIQTIQAPCPR